MIGVPVEDRHKIFDWSNRMIGSDDPEYSVTRRTRSARRRRCSSTRPSWPRRSAANPRDDLVSVLLQAEVDGERLSDTEFDLFFLLLAVAGNETTRNLISGGMLALIEHPEQRASCSTTRRSCPARSRRCCAGCRR